MTVIEIIALVATGVVVFLFLKSVLGKRRDRRNDGEQGPGPFYGDGGH